MLEEKIVGGDTVNLNVYDFSCGKLDSQQYDGALCTRIKRTMSGKCTTVLNERWQKG